jgi:hypothetical protein
MKKPKKQELIQAAISLLCVIVVGREIDYLGGSEFTGGYISGRLFWVADKAWLLFVLGLVLTFAFRRAAAVLLIVTALLTLPLYLFLTFPGVIRHLTGSEFLEPIVPNVVWDRWSIAGMLALLAIIYVCVRSLLAKTGATSQ